MEPTTARLTSSMLAFPRLRQDYAESHLNQAKDSAILRMYDEQLRSLVTHRFQARTVAMIVVRGLCKSKGLDFPGREGWLLDGLEGPTKDLHVRISAWANGPGRIR